MNFYGSRQLADSMRTVRRNTILIAEDIPETEYGYRPTEDSRSVAEILVHIATVTGAERVRLEQERLSSPGPFDFRGLIEKSLVEEKRPRSKREIIELLHAGGERWTQWIESLPETVLAEQVEMPAGAVKTRFELLLGTKEHEIHHRGQLMVIERLLGIVPHLTRQRQTVSNKAAS